MNRIRIYFFFILIANSSFGQEMLVTDFVFFNNFDGPYSANISDHFRANPKQFESVKQQLSQLMTEKYKLEGLSFDESNIWFGSIDADNQKSYSDNHKRLIKKGGFDYYLRLYSEISLTTTTSEKMEYTFDIQSRVSDKKGKKLDRSNSKILFSTRFTADSINSSELISQDDYFKLFKDCIGSLFEESEQTSIIELSKSTDQQFNEFTSKAEKYEIENFKSQKPTLAGLGEPITTRVRGGIDTDSDISEGGQVLYGDLGGKITALGIKNPKLEDWKVTITPKENTAFADLKLAPSGDLILRIGNNNPSTFKLINGKLTGKIQDQSFLVSLEPSAQLLRVFVDSELVALVQPIGDRRGKRQKIYYTGSAESIHKITNLIQVYHRTLAALEAIN